MQQIEFLCSVLHKHTYTHTHVCVLNEIVYNEARWC
jgi:hypothetical protein